MLEQTMIRIIQAELPRTVGKADPLGIGHVRPHGTQPASYMLASATTAWLRDQATEAIVLRARESALDAYRRECIATNRQITQAVSCKDWARVSTLRARVDAMMAELRAPKTEYAEAARVARQYLPTEEN